MKKIIFPLFLVALFAIALFSFAFQLAISNDSPRSLSDDPTISSYTGSLNNYSRDSSLSTTSALRSIAESPLSLTTGYYIIVAMGGLWKSIITTPLSILNLTFQTIFTRLLGDQTYYVVLSIIGTILGLSLIFAIYKLLSTGEYE